MIQDDVFRRLSACHNVLFTGHQAFLTAEALTSISQTTLQNLSNLERLNLPERTGLNLAAPLQSRQAGFRYSPMTFHSLFLK